MRSWLMIDSFWRAVAYCVHPRVIALSLLPLALLIALALATGAFLWEPALNWVRQQFESLPWLQTVAAWLVMAGLGALNAVAAPMVVIFLVTPVIVMLALLVVSVMLAPALARLVAQRRFAQLAREQGAGFWSSLVWALSSTLLALLALVLTMPLWLIPPLVLVLPPLIWGWLTCRVMAFDALAEHASRAERVALLHEHRWPLLLMGLISGFLSAAPGVFWASGALFAAAFVILAPLAIWVYTLVFAFTALWYAHYCLAALDAARRAVAGTTTGTATGTATSTPAGAPAARPRRDDDPIDVPARVVDPAGTGLIESREPRKPQ